MTKLNQTILETLRTSEGHMTAEEMFLFCKQNNIKVSLASTYRILGNLADEGYIKRLAFAGQPDVFDKTLDEHQHLVCDSCGKVKDILIKDFKGIIEEAANEKITSYSLTLNYTCRSCKKQRS